MSYTKFAKNYLFVAQKRNFLSDGAVRRCDCKPFPMEMLGKFLIFFCVTPIYKYLEQSISPKIQFFGKLLLIVCQPKPNLA